MSTGPDDEPEQMPEQMPNEESPEEPGIGAQETPRSDLQFSPAHGRDRRAGESA